MDNKVLGTNRRDVAAAVARAASGAIPGFSGVVTEIVNSIIPGQKLDRVITFVKVLEERVIAAHSRLDFISARLTGAEGSDLFEEAINQAARAVGETRRRQIANLIFNGITEDELRYDRVVKFLRLLGSLTDSELILLAYHSRQNSIGSEWHSHMVATYPDLLRPVSQEIGRPQADVERGALRASYEATLVGLQLLENRHGYLQITPLGKLLLRYVADPESAS